MKTQAVVAEPSPDLDVPFVGGSIFKVILNGKVIIVDPITYHKLPKDIDCKLCLVVNYSNDDQGTAIIAIHWIWRQVYALLFKIFFSKLYKKKSYIVNSIDEALDLAKTMFPKEEKFFFGNRRSLERLLCMCDGFYLLEADPDKPENKARNGLEDPLIYGKDWMLQGYITRVELRQAKPNIPIRGLRLIKNTARTWQD